MFALALNSLCPGGHTINFRKVQYFFTKKCGRLHLKTSSLSAKCPHWKNPPFPETLIAKTLANSLIKKSKDSDSFSIRFLRKQGLDYVANADCLPLYLATLELFHSGFPFWHSFSRNRARDASSKSEMLSFTPQQLLKC